MGYRDGQGFEPVQCGQDGDAHVCPECQKAGAGKRKPLIWRRRITMVLVVCVVLLVCAVAYAVAKGMPVPDAIGAVLGICVHVLMGI